MCPITVMKPSCAVEKVDDQEHTCQVSALCRKNAIQYRFYWSYLRYVGRMYPIKYDAVGTGDTMPYGAWRIWTKTHGATVGKWRDMTKKQKLIAKACNIVDTLHTYQTDCTLVSKRIAYHRDNCIAKHLRGRCTHPIFGSVSRELTSCSGTYPMPFDSWRWADYIQGVPKARASFKT